MRSSLLLCAALGALMLLPAAAGAADRPATPANFSSVFSSAQPGDRVLLAGGDYGSWTGGAKAGMVTVAPQPGAAVTIAVNFSGAANITLDGVTVSSLSVVGRSHDLRFSNSTFTGGATVRTDEISNGNIVFDGNTHAGIDVCSTCYEGRIEVIGANSAPSGVTIQNSRLGPGGNADGIQIGATGVKVLNNEFSGIKQISATHTDALQLYGAHETTIQGNYFHDNTTDIMAPDGGDHEVIANNVFVGDGAYRPAVQLGSQDSTQFVHNTTRNIDVFMDRKSESTINSTNGILRDNVLVNGTISTPSDKCTNCTVSYNLFSTGSVGSNAITGAPTFVGGASPTSWAGFALAAGSKGKGTASDGSDRGINVTAAPAPGPASPAPAAPAAPPAPAAVPAGAERSGAAGRVLGVAWRFSPRSPRAGKRVTLRAYRTAKAAKGKHCYWRFMGSRAHRGCTITVRFRSPGRKWITLYVRDKAGVLWHRTQALVVKRR